MSDTHVTASVIQAYPSPALAALEVNLAEHVAFVPRELARDNVLSKAGVTRVDSGLASDTFNKLLHARFEESQADAGIDQALEHFRRVERPFTWWVGPCSRPSDLEARLGQRGLQPLEHEIGMTLKLKDLPRDRDILEGFSIRRVTQLTELEHFAALLSNISIPADDTVVAYFEKASPFLLKDDCPMQFFVAYRGDEPAATVELMLSAYGDNPRGLAGVHMSATSAAYRHRGLELAMSWTALDHARQLGAELGGILVAPEAQNIFTELGFRSCGRFAEYQH